MMYLINKVASYFLFTKLQNIFVNTEWFSTILFLSSIECLILFPFVFYISLYIAHFTSIVVIPIMFSGSCLLVYILNIKVYEKNNKAVVYELAFTYNKRDLYKVRLIVYGVLFAAMCFFIGGINLIRTL